MKMKKKGSSSSSSSTRSNNPLLVADGNSSNSDINNNSSNSGDRRTSSVGCCGHLLILCLPIVASSFILALLIVLLRFDITSTQNQNQNQNQEANNEVVVVEGYYDTIQSQTISIIMKDYSPYWELILLSSVGAFLTCVVTIARNIQIYIYQQRHVDTTYTMNKLLNLVATIVNIISYIGLIITVAIKADSQDEIIHYIGAVLFFVGTGLYSVLHSYLLWTQKEQYNIFLKLLFTVFGVIIGVCSIVFGYSVLDGGLSEEATLPEYEWAACITTSISIGFYTILFYMDPVDDEIRDFFLCRYYRRRRG